MGADRRTITSPIFTWAIALIWSMIATGCGPTTIFTPYRATDPRDAWEELARRGKAFRTSDITYTAHLKTPRGNFDLKMELEVRDEQWRMMIKGAMGVKLALIAGYPDYVEYHNYGDGGVERLENDAELSLPQLFTTFPPPFLWLKALLPIPDIREEEGWRIERVGNSPDGLVLFTSCHRINPAPMDEWHLRIRTDPLAVLEDKIFYQGKAVFERTFYYSSPRYSLPAKMVVRWGEVLAEMEVRSVKIGSLVVNSRSSYQ